MKRVLSRLWAGWTGRIMLTFLGVVLLVGLFAPVLPLGDPVAMDPMQKLLGPSALHPFGTDHLGRDTLSRIIWGIRTTVYTSILAMIATSVIGALYGGIAGTAGGKTDSALMRFADFFMSFPSEVLILAMVGILGPGLGNIVIACIASMAEASGLWLRYSSSMTPSASAPAPSVSSRESAQRMQSSFFIGSTSCLFCAGKIVRCPMLL